MLVATEWSSSTQPSKIATSGGNMIKENYRLKIGRRLETFRHAPTEEIQQILKTCDVYPDLHLVRDIVRVVANTGMKNCELGSLLVSNIDYDGRWLLTSEGVRPRYPKRFIPINSKTLESLTSLHRLSPESPFVLGDFPRSRFDCVVETLRSRFPDVARGRLLMYSVRMNFAFRLMSSGIPLGIVKYCLGHQDLAMLFGKLSLTPEQKLAIIRRDLESFVPEL
jgi:integrase